MEDQHGHRIQLTVKSIDGHCNWGHKIGDQCEVSVHETAGLCGFLYNSIFTKINMLQFGGQYSFMPESDRMMGECPDPDNRLRVEIRRIK